ncbi:radical SAM protein [Puia sp. P3]|uniref:radical SAM protein n=1 Tax=Puia sp. P3 TaxID=3423952 RepID=UPI003D6703CC
MTVIADKYGRSFSTLRVSLLHHCNLGCVYCVSGNDELKQANNSGKTDTLAPDRLLAMIGRLHGQLGLKTIRLTGGEPLLYPGLVDLIRGIKALGIPKIKLTTNGFLLERLALPLKEAGMQSINVSLDAIDEDVFFAMSRRHLGRPHRPGIDAALAAGLNVKMNTVAMKGINDSRALPLAGFAAERGLKIRFLEVMAMGHLYAQADRHLLTQDEILGDLVAQVYADAAGQGGLQPRRATGRR